MPRPMVDVSARVAHWGGLVAVAACAASACAPAPAARPRPVGAGPAGATGTAQARARQPRCTDDSVTVGYGRQRRCDMTSAVSSLALDGRPGTGVGTLAELLRARVTGLDVITGPGGQLSLRVRGSSGTVLGTGEPLLVLDGMPVDGAVGAALAAIEPRDVSRVDVLKDAGSAAVYGSRAANGVVLITTRRR